MLALGRVEPGEVLGNMLPLQLGVLDLGQFAFEQAYAGHQTLVGIHQIYPGLSRLCILLHELSVLHHQPLLQGRYLLLSLIILFAQAIFLSLQFAILDDQLVLLLLHRLYLLGQYLDVEFHLLLALYVHSALGLQLPQDLLVLEVRLGKTGLARQVAHRASAVPLAVLVRHASWFYG